jgi:hypothetical protein
MLPPIGVSVLGIHINLEIILINTCFLEELIGDYIAIGESGDGVSDEPAH